MPVMKIVNDGDIFGIVTTVCSEKHGCIQEVPNQLTRYLPSRENDIVDTVDR
jgi:hypothetical protein